MWTPIELISWTGWSRDDWRIFLASITSFFLKYCLVAVFMLILLIDIILNGMSAKSWAWLFVFMIMTIGGIFLGKYIEEKENDREWRDLYGEGDLAQVEEWSDRNVIEYERPSEPSEPLHVEYGPGVDRRYQVFYRESSGLRSRSNC